MTDPEITSIIAARLNVEPHLVSGSIENNGDELHVSVAVPNISNAAIHDVARELGGSVLEVDIERDKSKTDFTVHDSSVVQQHLAKST